MNWLVMATPWLAVALLLGAPAFAFTVGPDVGYGMFLASVLCGVLGLPLNLYFWLRRREPLARPRTLVCALPIVLASFGIAKGAGHPVINDVSTDLENPPTIRVGGEDVPFPVNSRRALAQGKPEPWIVRAPFDQVQRTLLAVIASRDDWALEQTADGLITFVATSRLFRFKDDVTIRLTEGLEGIRVDVRSRSRMGKGDLGANKKRIQDLLNAARALLPGGR